MMTSIQARLWGKKHLDQVELAPNINQLQLEEVEEVGGQVLAQPVPESAACGTGWYLHRTG